jgi:hypothetical protein
MLRPGIIGLKGQVEAFFNPGELHALPFPRSRHGVGHLLGVGKKEISFFPPGRKRHFHRLADGNLLSPAVQPQARLNHDRILLPGDLQPGDHPGSMKSPVVPPVLFQKVFLLRREIIGR